MRLLFASPRVNGDVRDALQCLRFDGYQTGLLCREWYMGAASATPAQQRSKSEMKRHFNAIVESKVEGLARLDPQLYQMVASRAGLKPSEMVYVDTREDVLEPAREVGMTTVLASGGADGVKQVEALMDLPLTNFAWLSPPLLHCEPACGVTAA
jgi:epoxide hydrolase-like predicted phosphatase